MWAFFSTYLPPTSAEAVTAIHPPTHILSLNKDRRSQLRFVPEQHNS